MRKTNIIIALVLSIILSGTIITTFLYTNTTQTILKESKNQLEKYQKQQEEKRINYLEQNIKNLLLSNSKLIETVKINEIYSEFRDNEQRTEINKIKEKPTYDYLKSVTVYIKGTIPEATQGNGAIRVAKSWVGTGSIIKIENGETYILTNNHVTGYKEPDFDKTQLTIEENKYTYYAEVVKNSPDYDMAVIKVKGVIEGKQAIKGYNVAKIQDRVYSNGNYLALENIYTEGSLAGYYEKYLICNLPCAFGCSGSIVTNAKGEGIGLVFAIFNVSMFSPDTSKAICVKGEDIQNFLKELNLK